MRRPAVVLCLTSFIACTGPKGDPGPQGERGAMGTPGAQGNDGAMGAMGTMGTPGATGATGPTGASGMDGTNGVDGMTGPAGKTALVALATEMPGGNCPSGGIVVTSGLDANANGTLEAGEVTHTNYVCNGSPDTAAQVLAKLKSVDGKDSGVDADLLQGHPPSDFGIPAGTVIAYAGNAAPAGWLPCDGAAVSRSQFAALFAAIGSIHGNGDGATTFTLPDYRGRFLRGVDGAANRDPDKNTRAAPVLGATGAGNQVGSVQGPATARPATSFTTDTTGQHNHSNGPFDRLLQDSNCGVNTTNGIDATCGEPNIVSSGSIQPAGNHSHTVVGGGDNETRPGNAYVMFIIKT